MTFAYILPFVSKKNCLSCVTFSSGSNAKKGERICLKGK